MAAVVFNNTKYRFLENELVDFANDSERYYAIIGRSVPWNSTDTPPDPDNSLEEERNFRLSSVSLKEIIDCSLVVPRNNWTPGVVYPAYNDNTADNASNYHVITEELNVYICLRQGRNADGTLKNSTVQPTQVKTTPVLEVDGYVWKFLYNLGALQSNRFLTANFVPVRFVDSADENSPAADIKQKEIQDAAVSGQIAGFEVVNEGTGYSSAPTVTITGDGTGAQAVATVNGNVVTSVVIQNSGTTTFFNGSGYSYASAKLSGGGGSGATVRAILAPSGGFGADARKDLRSDAIMYNALFEGTDSNFLVTQDFRQIGLVVNPQTTDSSREAYGYDSAFSDESGLMLRKLYLQDAIGGDANYRRDLKIEGLTSGARAVIDEISTTSGFTNNLQYDGIIYYHQTEETGFGKFTAAESIAPIDSATGLSIPTSSKTLIANGHDSASKADKMSGTMLYLDNRSSIARSVSQDEDLKIVIKL